MSIPKVELEEHEIRILAELAAALEIPTEMWDDKVHETAESVAADANNGGLEEQIRFLYSAGISISAIGILMAEMHEEHIKETLESAQKVDEPVPADDPPEPDYERMAKSYGWRFDPSPPIKEQETPRPILSEGPFYHVHTGQRSNAGTWKQLCTENLINYDNPTPLPAEDPPDDYYEKVAKECGWMVDAAVRRGFYNTRTFIRSNKGSWKELCVEQGLVLRKADT